jgi:hypothetical protein
MIPLKNSDSLASPWSSRSTFPAGSYCTAHIANEADIALFYQDEARRARVLEPGEPVLVVDAENARTGFYRVLTRLGVGLMRSDHLSRTTAMFLGNKVIVMRPL